MLSLSKCHSMPVQCKKDEVMSEEEEKEFLERFIKHGYSLFSSKFEDLKAGKIGESSSFTGSAIGVTAGGLVAGASIFLTGGAGAATAGSKVKSASDTAFNYFGSEKFEKERKNILSWTNSVGKENEKHFLTTLSQGLAYICVSFKDQIKMFHPNDANNETFFNDVFRRIFNHMKQNPRQSISPLTPEEIFTCFIKGRSTPQRATDQFVPLITKLKKGRGMHLTGINGQELNTQTLFENTGHIVTSKESQQFSLHVQKASKKVVMYQTQDFRLQYDFEKEVTGPLMNNKLSETEFEKLYSEIKQDWRLDTENLQNFVTNIHRKVRTKEIFPGKWWPERKALPRAFHKRERDGVYLIEHLKKTLISDTAKRKLIISGGGGVGKSATAIWFALEYEKIFDHVIWLDCGVGCLQESFRRLARVLKIEDWNEMVTKDLAACCFNVLKDYNCLFIYDNSECYAGNDGIKNVLPEKFENRHVIITSRNKEWGNSTGLEKIQQFSVSVFNEIEAVEFMKASINGFEQEQKGELLELCYRLGYLPLALQISIATINQHEMPLYEYTMRIKRTDGLIETHFDYYENNINKTMSVSLDLIKSMERSAGRWAHQILNIFGYITAVNVQIAFFTALERNGDSEKTKEAAELLEKYSLVTFNKKNQSLSIHPLLQQVIRYNERNFENDTIRKVLKCVGFLEYKLIPYCFADEELKKEFPEIKSELIDKLELKKLLTDRRFQEAVELSRLIKEQCPSLSSLYNYAYCLKQNMEIVQAKAIFEVLYKKVGNIIVQCPFVQGIVSLFDLVHGKIVGGQLLQLYLQSHKHEKAMEIIRKSGVVFQCGEDSLNDVIKLFTSFRNCDFHYDGDLSFFSVSFQEKTNGNNFELSNCFVNQETFEKDLVLNELSLRKVKTSPRFFQCISSRQIQKLSLTDMILEFPCDFNAKVVSLNNVKVSQWGKSKWNVKELILNKVNFLINPAEMNVEDLAVMNAAVDVSVFPAMVKKLTLRDTVIINCSLPPDNNGLELKLPCQLEELDFTSVYFQNHHAENIEKVDISPSISPNLKKLTLRSEQYSSPWAIALDCISTIQYIDLYNCSLYASSELSHITPIELAIKDVTFFGLTKDLDETTDLANEFVDGGRLQKLTLEGQNWAVDLSDELWEFKTLEWKNSKLTINEVILRGFDSIHEMQFNVKEITIIGVESQVDILVFQKFHSLEKLELIECVLSKWSQRAVDKIKLPSTLKVLTLDGVKFRDSDGDALDPKEISVSSLIVPSVKKFMLNAPVQVSLHNLVDIPYLKLEQCLLIKYSKVRLRPVELELVNVKIMSPFLFFFWLRAKENVLVNDYVDFSQMKILYLNSKNFSIDMSNEVAVKEVTLLNTKWNWENVKWRIDDLNLHCSRQSTSYVSTNVPSSVKYINYVLSEDSLESDQNEQNSLKEDIFILDFDLLHS